MSLKAVLDRKKSSHKHKIIKNVNRMMGDKKMSIMTSLKEYLEKFEEIELIPVLKDTINSKVVCTIQPMENNKIEEDILRDRAYINSYMFYAKVQPGNEDCYKFLEEFLEWIEENDEKEIYPVINGYEVEAMNIQNVLLFNVDEYGHGIYQFQIQVRMRREKK